MIVTEKCSCGAEISVSDASTAISDALRSKEREVALAQLERWRTRHQGCTEATVRLQGSCDRSVTTDFHLVPADESEPEPEVRSE